MNSDNCNDIMSYKMVNKESLTSTQSPECFPSSTSDEINQQKEDSPECSSNNINNDPLLLIPHSFHKHFNLLKDTLNIEDTRKTHIDSLLKKCKSKCIKGIHEALKKCVNLIVNRPPQDFITNIKIDFNKIYLEKTIGEIYVEYKLLPPIQEIHNKKLIKKGRKELFEDLCTTKFRDVYQIYLDSQLYKRDFLYVYNKDGNENSQLYDFIAKNMCSYYLNSRGNKKKKNSFLKKKKMFDIKKINDDDEDDNDCNNINNNN